MCVCLCVCVCVCVCVNNRKASAGGGGGGGGSGIQMAHTRVSKRQSYIFRVQRSFGDPRIPRERKKRERE